MFLVEPWLEKPLSTVRDDSVLRRCACEFARFALEQTREDNPRAVQAITLAERVAAGQATLSELQELSAEMEPLLKDLQEGELHAHQAEHETLAQSIACYRAAVKIRPLSAAIATLNPSAREAAARAGYEARCSIEAQPGIEACKVFSEILGELSEAPGLDFLTLYPTDAIDAATDESSLRRCACKFARFALDECEWADPLILESIKTAEQFADDGASLDSLRPVRNQLRPLAELAGDRELEAQEEIEGKPTLKTFIEWFERAALARAFNAALATLHESAKEAARNAHYEASSTIGTKAAIGGYRRLRSVVAALSGDAE